MTQALFAKCHALILAAGGSTRFGSQKLLAPFDGRPLIVQTVDRVVHWGFDTVTVVLGSDAQLTAAALATLEADADIRVVTATGWRDGLSSSLATGLEATPDGPVMIFLADMPFVSPEDCATLLSVDQRQVYAARLTYADQPGHPVLLTAAGRLAMGPLCGDKGLSDQLKQWGDHVVFMPTDNFGCLRDIDTPDDLKE